MLKVATRNLSRHRARTLIALSAIAFGVIALLMAGGFMEWIFWAMREGAIQTGVGHIQISRPGFQSAGLADPAAYLLPADASQLGTIHAAPGVEVVDRRLVVSGLASNGETTVGFSGLAVDPAADTLISKRTAVLGENLSSSDAFGVVVGNGLAQTLRLRQGDPITFLVSLPGGGINAVEGHIRGISTTGFKQTDDSAVRMPLTLGLQLLRVRGAHLWVVGLHATESSQETVAYLRERLPAALFEVTSWLELSDFYRKAVALLSRQIDVVALLIAVVIVLGISNTLIMNVLERTGEIGTMMAMGTPRREILLLFIFEGVLLGAIGGLCGLAIGYALAEVVSYVGIPMPPPPGRSVGYLAKITLTAPLVFGGFAVAVVSTALASFYPAWKGSRLPIVDALRHNR